MSVEEARKRARATLALGDYKHNEGRLAKDVLALADENERLVREYVEPMASGVVPWRMLAKFRRSGVR